MNISDKSKISDYVDLRCIGRRAAKITDNAGKITPVQTLPERVNSQIINQPYCLPKSCI
jgi:hypothetical protein